MGIDPHFAGHNISSGKYILDRHQDRDRKRIEMGDRKKQEKGEEWKKRGRIRQNG